jgi:hypothetical protein
LTSLAIAAPQVKVRAALLVRAKDGLPGAVVARTEGDLRELLEGSGRYLFVDEIALQARTGSESAELLTRCGQDEACWAQLTQELAVDQLLVLELSGDAMAPRAELSVRDAAWPEAPRRYLSTLPRGGGAPLEILDDAFFADGALRVQAPVGVRMSLDGESLGEVGGLLELPLVEGGKHTLGMEDQTGRSHLLVVQVVPGRETVVDCVPPPPLLVRKRWGPWASTGLVVASLAVILVGQQGPGRAVEPAQ